MERSCIDLTNIEPCVNKAVANLESLKDTLAYKANQGISEQELLPLAQSVRERPRSVKLKLVESSESNLSVEGIRTGIILEKYRRASLAKKVDLLSMMA